MCTATSTATEHSRLLHPSVALYRSTLHAFYTTNLMLLNIVVLMVSIGMQVMMTAKREPAGNA